MALTPIAFAQYQDPEPTYHDPVVIQKDARGRLPPAEAAELQAVYLGMEEASASVWIQARVNFDPDVTPESPEGVAQQRRIDHAIEAILGRLERKGIDTRMAERTEVGPYVALPLVREGIDELVADRSVDVFYIMLPKEY
jgi:hypothetical protein